ncbi:MAG: cation:proton antiporter [Candidatus Saccharimonadales bacterium]
MDANLFAQFSFIIALAAGVALLMRIIKQPLIIGYILTGLLVGPSVLHLVGTPATFEVFSNIGIALLLFIIGLGLNPRVIKEVGNVAAISGVLQVGLTTAIGYGGGLIFGFGRRESLLFGIALAFSSTIIILKLLSDKKEQTRLYGKVVTGLLLIQDILAMFALLFITSEGNGGHFAIGNLITLFAKGALIAIPLLVIGNVVLPKLHKFIAGSSEFLFLFALGWGFGSAALFEMSGFSLEFGALLAGIALASLPYTQEISARLRPLRDFFLIVFFIALGTRLDFAGIGSLLPIIIISSLIVIVLKPVIVTLIMGVMGYTKRTSFKTGLATAQVSEFSLILVILANKQGLVSNRLVSLITLLALISIAVSAYLILYSDQLFVFFEKHFLMFERHKARFERDSRRNYELVLFGYRKGGHEFLKVFRGLKKRFVVVDYDPEVIDILEHQKVDYVYGDIADLELLEEIGLDKIKLAVSTITDHPSSLYLVKLLGNINPNAVVICHADTLEQAAELYAAGASYVMMPHYISSEKIGSLIKRSEFKRSEFKRFREKHLEYLETHYKDFETDDDEAELAASEPVS